MEVIFRFPQVLYFIILGVSLGYGEDDIQKGKAFATPSYSNKELEYQVNFIEGDSPNSINVRLSHSSNNGFLNVIEIISIPKSNDTTYLTHFDEIPNEPIDIFRAFFFVNIDEDAIGDVYFVDTTSPNSKNFIVLEDITNRKITGMFQIHFVLDPPITWTKFDESIPDTFNLSNRRFSAEKY